MPRYKNPLGGPAGSVVAYCRFHKCCITARQMRGRECLRKHCRHLQKREHPYWEQREQSREHRAKRKQERQALMMSLGGGWK